MSEIIYDCRWSDSVDDKFIKDFVDTENVVFNCNYTEEYFKKKYLNNIYGKSVVEVVYVDGEPVAARALWRNDIDGKPSYQPGDTCVTEVCRGKGIFTEMTKRSIDMLSSDDLIYNFPNKNSFPGYMKMGWKLVKDYNLVLFSSVKNYLKEHPVIIDDEYVNWWIQGSKDVFYIKRGNKYFLVKPINTKFCYKVCGSVSKESALKFNKAPFGIYFYYCERTTFYNKTKPLLHVVSKSDGIEYIPVWKIDVI